MRAAAPAWAPALLALLLLSSGGGGGVTGQQLTPFLGRNTPPVGGVDVYVSAIVDHLISVDDAAYKFNVVLYIQLTWRDARAAAAVNASTQAALTDPSYNNGNGCAYPCTTIYAWDRNPNATNLCCDAVWLPHFEFINVVGFSQDRVVRYGVQLGEGDAVAWWQHIQAEMYTPMSFNAFPFDTQYLSVQLQYGNKYPESPINIVPSATGTQLYIPASGDQLSGWTVKGLTMRTLNLSQQDLVQSGGSTYSAPGDPWPLHPADPSQPAFQGMLWQNGVEIFIQVQRISLYYIIIAILPVYINTCLALLVFSVNPRHLDTRLGIVVTLFLSLTALQFVIAAGLPSSDTVVPTQQLIIVSYCILGGIGICSIVVFWMVNLHRTAERRRRLRQAQRQFTQRWASVTHSLGVAAASAAVAALEGQQQAPADGDGRLSLRQPAKQQQQAGFMGPAELLDHAEGTPSALPALPLECSRPAPVPSSSLAVVGGSLAAQPSATPLAAGMGVCAAGSSGDDDSDVPPSDDASSPRHGGLRVSEAPCPVAAADEEDGAAKHALPGWLTRPGCCGLPSRKGRGSGAAGVGGGVAAPTQPGWLRLHWYKLRLMREEMRRSQDYAMAVALRIDRTILWSTLVGFNVAVIAIFASQAGMDAEPLVA